MSFQINQELGVYLYKATSNATLVSKPFAFVIEKHCVVIVMCPRIDLSCDFIFLFKNKSFKTI